VPVVSTVAVTGEGVSDLRRRVAEVAAWSGVESPPQRRYSDEVEARLDERARTIQPHLERVAEASLAFRGVTPRSAVLALLEGFGEVRDMPVLDALRRPSAAFAMPGRDGSLADEELALRVAAERHAAAQAIAATCSRGGRRITADALWKAATSASSGVPILVGVLGTLFVVLFLLGGWISTALTWLWDKGPSPLMTRGVHSLLGNGAVGDTLLWGINGGIFATLAVGIPYVATFYIMMAALEDSGYMSAVAYLSDRVMHRFGLHGRAVIPLIAAGGCNVPAIMGLRVLTSRRERLIAGTLATLVPCSARTAVIVGAVSLYAGWGWALLVYAVVTIVGVTAGLALNRILPGETGGFVMEMFPLRKPSLRLVVRKTWARLRDFVWIAAPVVLGGSLLLGALYESGAVWHLAAPLSPIVEGWLGLPAVAGLTLIFAVLRKELALQLLVAFAVVRYGSGAHDLLRFMTIDQIVVYALVSTLYVPCAATIAVLGRELGWKAAAGISAGTLAVALLVGGVAARLLSLS
jgi:ferrous iron transport protein B